MSGQNKLKGTFDLLISVLTENIAGDITELGCYNGNTSIMIQKLLEHFKSAKEFHVYDSFEGLPELSNQDKGTTFAKGSCSTTKDNFIRNFSSLKVKLPFIHQGWFEATLEKELPDKVCFAYLDGDFYSSILYSLEMLYPRMPEGGIAVIDDYTAATLPGVKNACDIFFSDKAEKIEFIIYENQYIAYFKKLISKNIKPQITQIKTQSNTNEN